MDAAVGRDLRVREIQLHLRERCLGAPHARAGQVRVGLRRGNLRVDRNALLHASQRLGDARLRRMSHFARRSELRLHLRDCGVLYGGRRPQRIDLRLRNRVILPQRLRALPFRVGLVRIGNGADDRRLRGLDLRIRARDRRRASRQRRACRR